MKVKIDRDMCIGCESCVEFCPDVFAMEGELAVTRLKSDIPEELQDLCREMAESCPVESIHLE